jgi:hypothetical protein
MSRLYGTDVESRIMATSKRATFGPEPVSAAGFSGTMPIVGRKRRAVWEDTSKMPSFTSHFIARPSTSRGQSTTAGPQSTRPTADAQIQCRKTDCCHIQ